MAYKILVNDTNQEIKVAILERAGDDPGNNGPQSSEVTIAPGANHTFQYGGPYLNGLLVAVGTRGVGARRPVEHQRHRHAERQPVDDGV